MPDYRNGKIYRITLPGDERVYIGSTVNSLCRRMTGHRDTFHKWLNGLGTYCSSYALFLDGEPTIELVELCACDNVTQLHRREGEVILMTPNCINCLIAGRTYKEWYATNKDVIQQKTKLYRDAHKIEISQRNKVYRDANIETVRAYSREYCEKHRVDKKAYDARRRTEQREHVNALQRKNHALRRAKKAAAAQTVAPSTPVP